MTVSEVSAARWRKSSRSGAGNDCVELAVGPVGAAVRDSKNTGHGHLAFGTEDWRVFLAVVKQH